MMQPSHSSPAAFVPSFRKRQQEAANNNDPSRNDLESKLKQLVLAEGGALTAHLSPIEWQKMLSLVLFSISPVSNTAPHSATIGTPPLFSPAVQADYLHALSMCIELGDSQHPHLHAVPKSTNITTSKSPSPTPSSLYSSPSSSPRLPSESTPFRPSSASSFTSSGLHTRPTIRTSSLSSVERTGFLESTISELLAFIKSIFASSSSNSGSIIPNPNLASNVTIIVAPPPGLYPSTTTSPGKSVIHPISSDSGVFALAVRLVDRLLIDNGVYCPGVHSRLFDVFGPIVVQATAATARPARQPTISKSAVAAIISCFGSVCMGSGSKGLSLQQRAIQLILPLLPKPSFMSRATSDKSSAVTVDKSSKSICKCLMLIVNENKAAINRESIAQLIPGLKLLCFYQSQATITSSSAPFQQNAWGSGNNMYRSPSRSVGHSKYSDSDVSDATSAFSLSFEESMQLSAIQCVTAIAKANPKLLYPYWHLFLDPAFDKRASLFWFIRNATNSRIRTSCLILFQAMLEGSKAYLSAASDEAPRPSSGSKVTTPVNSFTSLSAKLASQIATMHDALVLALRSEREDAVVIHILRCLGALIKTSPYSRLLAIDHRRRLMDTLLDLYARKVDINVKVCALECVAFILDTPVPLCAVAEGASASSLVATGKTMYHHRTEEILDIGVEMAASKILVLQVSAFQLLSTLCKTAWPLVYALWATAGESQKDANLRTLVERSATSHIFPLMLACFKFLEAFMHAVSFAVNVSHSAEANDAATSPDVAEEQPTSHRRVSPIPSMAQFTPPPKEFWTHLMDKYVCMGLTHPTSDVLRALACDAFSHLPEFVFLDIPSRRRNAWMGLAVSIMGESDGGVKAAGARVLGVFLSYPCMYNDALFIEDVISILPPLLSPIHSIPVRVRASWALANLCDVLEAMKSTDPTDSASLSLTPAKLWTVARACTLAAKDNEKCRVNGVRALGNLVKSCFDELACSSSQQTMMPERGVPSDTDERTVFIQEIVHLMVKNFEAGSVKTRWNACHAVANMLKHPAFPIGQASWSSMLYEGLIRTVSGSKNFKVRLSAVSALQVVLGRVVSGGGPYLLGQNAASAKRILEQIVQLSVAPAVGEDVALGSLSRSRAREEAGDDEAVEELTAGFLEMRYVDQLDEQLSVLSAQAHRILTELN